MVAGGPQGPVAFTLRDGRTPNVRRILIDVIEEYARHVGHADLIRESIDGRVGEDPPN
jgi:ribosomal protein S3AE